jgi:hypothetical protein
MITTTGSRTTTNPAEGEEVKYQLDTETLYGNTNSSSSSSITFS